MEIGGIPINEMLHAGNDEETKKITGEFKCGVGGRRRRRRRRRRSRKIL